MDEAHEKKMAMLLFEKRKVHLTAEGPLDREIAFYESICSGNLETVWMLSTLLENENHGTLSQDPLRDLQYHFAISAALIARFCMNSGMSAENAYKVGCAFIQRADECQTEDEVHETYREMVKEFTLQMRVIRTGVTHSEHIMNAIDYISKHLSERLTITDVAQEIGLSVGYLSRLFKLEMGIAFSDYVSSCKVECAADLMCLTDYSEQKIADLLGFCSQSYFIKVFRQYEDMTPREYRQRYFSSLNHRGTGARDGNRR